MHPALMSSENRAAHALRRIPSRRPDGLFVQRMNAAARLPGIRRNRALFTVVQQQQPVQRLMTRLLVNGT